MTRSKLWLAVVLLPALALGSDIGTGDIVAGNPVESGTNTGDVTIGTFGSSPAAKGLTISSQVLTLQPADATHPGAITTGTQTIAGNKTLSGNVAVGGTLAVTGDLTAATVDVGTGYISSANFYAPASAPIRLHPAGGGGGYQILADTGVQLNAIADAKPTCNSAARGTLWYAPGGAGVADTMEVCAKAAADTYAWRSMATIP